MKPKTDTGKCPECSENTIIPEYDKMEYHRHGRKFRCSECGKYIMFTNPAGNMQRDENGTLHCKYKPKK